MKRLDQILEECIDAGVSGRRSVEQSLALYPAVADELEPLLRTALQVSGSFRSYTPPASIEERGRNRFLQDAAARKKIRHLAGTFQHPNRFSGFWRTPAFGGLSAAAAVLVIAVAVAAGGFNSGSDEGATVSNQPGDSPSAVTVTNIQSEIEEIRERYEANQPVTASDFDDLSRLLAALRDAPQNEFDAAGADLDEVIKDAYELLNAVRDVPGIATAVEEPIEDTRDIAGFLDLDLPGPIGTPSTVSTPPAETPTTAPTEEPTADPTEVPTEQPTESPATETPAPTTDLRQPPGFLP